jgi:hypothetical protein
MSFAVSNEEVQALFDKELQKANKGNPQFHSAHEAYAVLLEEVEEAKEELSNLDYYTGYIWDTVKNGGCLRSDLEWTKKFASSLIREAIQVGAMCDKFQDFLDKGETEC